MYKFMGVSPEDYLEPVSRQLAELQGMCAELEVAHRDASQGPGCRGHLARVDPLDADALTSLGTAVLGTCVRQLVGLHAADKYSL